MTNEVLIQYGHSLSKLNADIKREEKLHATNTLREGKRHRRVIKDIMMKIEAFKISFGNNEHNNDRR